jgi:hypothetical protein
MRISTIINDTTQVFEIDEGNTGVYTTKSWLDSGQRLSIKFDPNATYREYWLKNEADEKVLDISTDDLAEYNTITIYVTPNGSVGWRGARHDKSFLKRKVLICIHTPHCMHSRVFFISLLFTKSSNYN